MRTVGLGSDHSTNSATATLLNNVTELIRLNTGVNSLFRSVAVALSIKLDGKREKVGLRRLPAWPDVGIKRSPIWSHWPSSPTTTMSGKWDSRPLSAEKRFRNGKAADDTIITHLCSRSSRSPTRVCKDTIMLCCEMRLVGSSDTEVTLSEWRKWI